MADLNPLSSGRQNVPARRQQSYYPGMPMSADRFLDDLFNLDFPLMQTLSREFVPSMEVSENDKEVMVDVELPGIDPKDVDINLSGNVLTIKGEKRIEEESRDRGIYRSERRYGTFVRSVELPSGLDFEKVSASHDNGVLRIRFPQSEENQKRTRSIPIQEHAQSGTNESAESGKSATKPS